MKTPQPFRASRPLRALNRLSKRVAPSAIPLDESHLLRWAERTTGLGDWGDDATFFERLQHHLDAIESVGLNPLGRFGARVLLQWKMTNKLRHVEARKQHPELADIPIKAPLVILGWYRTGTTFLHNVLAADPANRAARAWELAFPFGSKANILGNEARRRAWARATFGLDHVVLPDQSDAHHVTPESYEECFFLLENELASITLFNAFGTWDYARDVLDTDMVTPYRSHKSQLQALTAQRSSDRWLLKCPWHLWNLDALLAVYPDARVVHTHRDVPKALASQCSLSARMTGKFLDNLDPQALGAFWADYFALGLERGLQSRSLLPASQVYDLRLKDLIKHPVDTLRDLYSHFDLPFDGELEDRFIRRIAEQPTGRLRDHEYSIDTFGFSEQSIRERFSDYRARFGV